MAFADFESAVVHGYASVVQFLGCVSKALGRLETATGTALAISCKQVLYSPDLPTITFPDFRHKKTHPSKGRVEMTRGTTLVATASKLSALATQ